METQTGFQSGLEQLTAESVFEYYDQDRQEALNSTQDIDNILLKNERIILESELRLQQRKREFNTVFGQMLLETDAPSLAPEPHRGELCTPTFLPLIAKSVAEVWGVRVEEVDKQTTENAIRLFVL